MPKKILIVIAGESNSAGRGVNSDALSAELSTNSRLQILHNIDLVFQDLNIGTNNIVDHAATDGSWRSTRHGWELALSNAVRSNTLGSSTVYLLKTGQGGSRISEWGAGGSYRTKLIQRIDAAKSLLGNDNIQPVVWYTQGINDAIDNNPVATWSAATRDYFAYLKSIMPGVPILMCGLTPAYGSYTAECQDIARSINKVRFISTDGADLDNGDVNHWGYHGVKTIGQRLVGETLSFVSPRRL